MAKVLEAGGGQSLDPKDFTGDVIVVTIESSDNIQTRFGTRRIVRLVEYPEKPYWANVTQTMQLVKLFGDDDDHWKGKRLALEKVGVKNPRAAKGAPDVVKFYPVDVAEHDDVIAQYDKARASTDAAPKGRGKKRA